MGHPMCCSTGWVKIKLEHSSVKRLCGVQAKGGVAQGLLWGCGGKSANMENVVRKRYKGWRLSTTWHAGERYIQIN